MSHVIFIGGATASGKTSLIKELECFNITRYKIKWALREAGFRKNIPIKDIGNNYESLITVAKNILITEILPNKEILILDTHYAIQLNLSASLSNGDSYIENINEPYIAGIDNSILKELSKIAKSISFIFIQAPTENILSRRLIRKEQHKPYRSLNINSISKETAAEKEYFFKSISLVNTINNKLDQSQCKTLILDNKNGTFLNQLNILKTFISIIKKGVE